MQWLKRRSVLETEALEMIFKEREEGTVTEGLMKGIPQSKGSLGAVASFYMHNVK